MPSPTLPPYCVTSPAPRDRWQHLVATDPQVLVTQTPEWVDTICATGPYCDVSRLYEMADGRTMLLPLVRAKYRPGPLAVESSYPPAWGMGGLIGSAPIGTAEVATVFADLQQRAVLSTTICPNPLADGIWAAAAPPGTTIVPRLAHVVDLSDGFDQVWTKRFSANTRHKVRKAERAGVVVECDTTGRLAPVFYQLLEQSFDRWGAQQHEPRWLARWRGHQRDPLTKFVQMAKLLKERCRLWVAWVQGEPAAALVVLQGTNAHYTRGAMNKALAGPTFANYLLHSSAIADACQAGCHTYHMGESGTSGALAHFKSHFGAVAVPYADYTLEKIPITAWDKQLRGMVKRLIGFQDTSSGPTETMQPS